MALGAGLIERDVQSAEDADGLFDERDDVILPGDIGLYKALPLPPAEVIPGRPPLPRQPCGRRDANWTGDEILADYSYNPVLSKH